jgi:uncharacterized protein DUF4126
MEPVWLEAVLSVAVGLGLAAAAGLRVFVPLLVLGGAARLGWLPLASGFEWLASGSGLTTLGVATILEVAAYYIPWVDNLLDLVAGPLAVMAGILATAAVTTELPPALRWSAAIIAGGGTAAAVQGVTSITRLKSTAVTAGAANPLLATLELVGSLTTSIVAVVLPALAIFLVVGLLLLARRASRRLFRRQPIAPAQ